MGDGSMRKGGKMDPDRIRIQTEDFSIEDETLKVRETSKRIGGIVSFLGTARDFSKGQEIHKIDFEHYPGMAEKKLSEIREQALKDYDIIEVTLIHRVGERSIGENIVLIIVGAEHRQDAFRACSWCIDELKRITPIWKKETTPKGVVWVEEHP
ncbi:molybdenum cofactor biosynthesis protein MoaE [Nitrospira defluvii]|nr:molybdenum cofactor biosynthesis protein MoaE [Nitrospira defluvii]